MGTLTNGLEFRMFVGQSLVTSRQSLAEENQRKAKMGEKPGFSFSAK